MKNGIRLLHPLNNLTIFSFLYLYKDTPSNILGVDCHLHDSRPFFFAYFFRVTLEATHAHFQLPRPYRFYDARTPLSDICCPQGCDGDVPKQWDVTVSTPTYFVTERNPNMPVCLYAKYKGGVEIKTFILDGEDLKVAIGTEPVWQLVLESDVQDYKV